MNRPFSDADLLAYSAEHVLYEVDMFFGMVDLLTKPSLTIGAGSTAEANRVKNALIEAFAVHLRNIIDFLYMDQPQPTDVVAADFLSAGSWKSVRPTISKVLEDARIRANKELAHLTTKRLAGISPGKQWSFSILAGEVKALLNLFIAQAKPGALSPLVAGAVR